MDITLVFGDRLSSINPQAIKGIEYYHKGMPVIFQHQVHGNTGLAVTHSSLTRYKTCLMYESDYLITNLKGVALGVLTADCVPIALFDSKRNVIGMVHAGWRGTVGCILIHAVRHMFQLYGTCVDDLTVFFGPCARACCYQVDALFIQQLPKWAKSAIVDEVFFDLVRCNQLLLNEIGILSSNIDNSLCSCTICTHGFCSYRKNPLSEARQVSIIALN
jgi:polyphenol oxidase